MLFGPSNNQLCTLLLSRLYLGFVKCIFEFPTVVATHKHDCGRLAEVEEVIGPTHIPCKQYPFPKESIPAVQLTIDSLLHQGVLREGSFITNSPVWPVKKPDGSWRLTIDYRQLNTVTPACAPVVSDMSQLLKNVPPHARYFSTLDISNGFWSILVKFEYQYKFAFTFNGHQYTWTMLPQGFHNSPTIFHKRMVRVLEGIVWPPGTAVLQYVDDILIATDMEEAHEKALRTVLMRLSLAGLKLNRTKVHLCVSSVPFLGIELNTSGVSPDDRKIATIQKLPFPVTTTALRSFLGLVGYQRQFLPQLAELAALIQAVQSSMFQRVNVWSDSTYVVNTVLLLPLYASREFCTAAGKPLIHSALLMALANLFRHRSAPTYVSKVAGHVHTGVHATGNAHADSKAKQAAQTGDPWPGPVRLPSHDQVNAILG